MAFRTMAEEENDKKSYGFGSNQKTQVEEDEERKEKERVPEDATVDVSSPVTTWSVSTSATPRRRRGRS